MSAVSYGNELPLLEVCIANLQSKLVAECFPLGSWDDRFDFLVNNAEFATGRSTFEHSLRNGQVDVYHCLVKDNLVFLCFSTSEAKLRVAYNFLAEVEECYSNGESGVDFLRTLMEKWNKPDADKVNAARVKMDQIKKVMIQNIDKALLRGAALSDLDDRAERLMEDAHELKVVAGKLKKKFQWEHWKIIAIVVAVVVVIITIVVVAVMLSE